MSDTTEIVETLHDLTVEEIDAGRRAAYQAEADPLYFAWKRGEGTEEAWLAKIAEIKTRLPKPE